jgi:hypothetical protein
VLRRLFGGWGWELSDREFGQALALLGVAAHAERGDRASAGGHRALLTATDAQNLLGAAMAQAGDGPLVWDVGSAAELRVLAARLQSVRGEDLVGVWTAAHAGGRTLEVRPAAGIDDRATYELLADALDAGVPHFPLTEPPGRLRWHWPTRVGYRAEDDWNGAHLFERLSPTIAGLTEHAIEPIRCDIFLAWTSYRHRFAVIAQDTLPEATFVIVFETTDEVEPLRRAVAIARRAEARGVAVVGLSYLGQDREAEWFRSFLREISHEVPLFQALREAGRLAGVFAGPELVRAVPLRLAGEMWIARMERTLAMTAAEPPPAPALPSRTTAALVVERVRAMSLPELGTALRTSNLAFASEGEGATDVAIVGRAVEPMIRELEAKAAEDRYIRAAIEAIRRGKASPLRVRQGFRAGTRHRVSVSIGPREKGFIVATEAIPPEALADAAGHRLTVVLAEPTLLAKPLVRTLELPAFGTSGPAEFELPVPRSADAVEARITVLHRGRILQTAILHGPVLSAAELERRETAAAATAHGAAVPAAPGATASPPHGIEIVPEANLRPGFPALDDRRRFQAAIVLNEDRSGRHGGTWISGTKAAQFNFDFLKEAVAGVAEVLDRAERDAAFERKLDSAKSIAYLRKLATEGSGLYTAIGAKIVKKLGAKRLERLQVLSANANTMLPVELIYDLPPPAPDETPTLCENAANALHTGQCQSRFHVPNAEDFLTVICPSGFWGISKIIERQATDGDEEARAAFEVRRVGDQRRTPLRSLVPVMLAASDHVNDVQKNELKRITRALELLTNNRVTPVRRWRDWAEVVQRDQPPVLVVLSHTELTGEDGPALEIAKAGGTERRAVTQIRKSYVNPTGDQPGPVVLLLGCTTAVPLKSFQSFTVQFGAMGAAVVIGTIAPVLGRHASRTAEALLEELGALGRDAATRNRGVPVGEALRDVRRRLLGKGILMSMSLAAYGDADWRLPVEA